LTGFQPNYRGGRSREQRASWVAVILCLSLLALLAVVQVAHIHAIGSNADQCPLCIAMQSAAPVAAIAAVIILIRIQNAAQVYEARAVVRHWHPKLFTRPPPAGR